MYCGQCGSEVNDDARFCPSCGAPLVRQDQPQQGAIDTPDSPYHTVGGGQAPHEPSGGPVPHIKNYLVESILCTICCCLPFGIPGIVFAAQVDGKLRNGDVEGAIQSSEKAKKWTLVALIVGLVVKLLAIGLNIANARLFGDYFNPSTWY